MKLGNDFTNEESDASNVEESDEKTSAEEVEDEEATSADADEGKKQEDESETESAVATEVDNSKSEETDQVDKLKVLQGLRNTEKELGNDVADIDQAISAARQRINGLRQDRREKRDLVHTIDSKLPDKEEEVDDLSDIDSETIKVLERFTRAKGLVPKSELAQLNYQEHHKTAEDLFYKEHSEYLPENDPNDILYQALKKELSYFATPSDPKLIQQLFEKAHREVSKQFPDRFKNSKSDVNSTSNSTISRSVRIKSSSLGGSPSASGASSGSGGKSLTESQIRTLQDGGWSAEEIVRLNK